jgi:hypothetical protein
MFVCYVDTIEEYKEQLKAMLKLKYQSDLASSRMAKTQKEARFYEGRAYALQNFESFIDDLKVRPKNELARLKKLSELFEDKEETSE